MFKQLVDNGRLAIDAARSLVRGDRTPSGITRQLSLTEFEDRLLFSASPLVAVAEAVEVAEVAPVVVETNVSLLPGDSDQITKDVAASEVPLELVFVDTNSPGYELLVEDLLNEDDAYRAFQFFELDPNEDGIQQITDALGELNDVSAIHIVSHGSFGEVQLGNTRIGLDNLAPYAGLLGTWGDSLPEDADLLFYGCNLAGNADGESLIQSLSALTGADVAASDDLTGHQDLGGDWELEYTTGDISSALAFSVDVQQNWVGLLPTNTAPVNSVPNGQIVYHDELLEFNSANGNLISISDPDFAISPSSPMQVTLSLTSASGGSTGGLSLSQITGLNFITGDGTDDSLLTFSGLETDINLALDGLRYLPEAGFTDIITLQIETNDLGSGLGPAIIDTDNVTIAVVNELTGDGLTAFDVPDAAAGPSETNTGHRGSHSATDVAPNGNHVIVYSNYDDIHEGTDWDVYFKLFDSEGNELNSGVVNPTGGAEEEQSKASVAMAADGSFVVTWIQNKNVGAGSPDNDLYIRRFDAAGNSIGNQIEVEKSNENPDAPSIAMNASGLFAVAWEQDDSEGNAGLWLQRFSADGTLIDDNAAGLETAIKIQDSDANNTSVGIDRDGNVLVTWNIPGSGIFSQTVDSSGVTGVIQTISADGDAAGATVDFNEAGDGAIAWHSTATRDIHYATISIDGTLGTLRVEAETSRNDVFQNASVSIDQSGEFAIGWIRQNSTPFLGFANAYGDDLYVATYDSAGDRYGLRLHAQAFLDQHSSSGTMLDVNNTVGTFNNEYFPSNSAEVLRTLLGTDGDAGTMPPVLDEIDDVSGSVGTSISFEIFVGDVDSEIQTLSINTASTNAAVVGNSDISVTGTGFYRTVTMTPLAAGITTITIEAEDPDGLKTPQSFDVTVDNQAPVISNATMSITENTANGSPVFTVPVVDSDGPSRTFRITGGNTGGAFAIDDLGQITVANSSALNFEGGTTSFALAIEVDDSIDTDSATITINVTNVNESPTIVSLSNSTVIENSMGAIVGDLSTADPDSGDSHTYVVDDTRFEVVSGQLKLKATESLDRETEPTLSVSVTSTDVGLLSSSAQSFTLTVQNVNEAPTGVSLSNSTVSENAAGAIVGDLSTVDPDSGDSHTYVVDDARFEVVGGQLKLKATESLDRETEPTLSVSVTSTDVGLLSSSAQSFTLTVQNVNEAPTGVSLSNSTVSENAVGAIVGNLSTVDPDSGDSHTYVVDDARFEVVSGQLKLKATESLDRETEPTLSVSVTSTDVGLLSSSAQSFTLTVQNVNEAPTGVSLSNSTVSENAVGAIVGNLSTVDPDSGDSHTYVVDDARFEVVGGQLKLKDTESLDHEPEPTLSVSVTSTDVGLLSSSAQSFTLTVQNVNEAPTGVSLSSSTISENSVGVIVGNLSTSDPDSGDSHTYVVDDARFEVVGGQLKLKDTASLDHETEPTLSVSVTSTDVGLLSGVAQPFTLTVQNVNEAPTSVALSNSTVSENSAGAIVGNLSTGDPDNGDSYTYTVDDSRFEVVGGQLKLKNTASLDHEAEPTLSVAVTSTDAGLLSTSAQSFTLTVQNVNESPTAIGLSNSTVNENTVGAVVGSLSTSDPETTDSHTYTVNDARFEVVGGQLKLKDTVSLDHETEPTIAIVVTADDGVSATYDEAFSLTVVDTNDLPGGSDSLVRVNSGNDYVFALADFGFADADTGDQLAYLTVKTPPTTGELIRLSTGDSIGLNEQILRAELLSGDIAFRWSGVTALQEQFVFQVNDGTADAAASNTLTLDLVPKLVAHLRFDDAGGTIAVDSSGNGNNGTLVGNATWTDGEVGGGLDFNYNDGVDYVELGNSVALDGLNTGDYAISAWFRPDSLPPGLDTQGGSAGNDNFYSVVTRMGRHTGINYLSNGKYQLAHWIGDGASSSIVVVDSAQAFLPGEYHHVAGTVDSVNGTIELFVNGVSQGTASFTPGAAAMDYGSTPWRIGAARPDAYATGTENYGWAADGAVDDVRLFSGTLSTSEVGDLYKLGNDAPIANNDTYTTIEDTGFDTANDWHNAGWSHRRTLTLDNSALTTDLADFPVLVALDSTRIDYSLTQANGEDLRFVDADGNLLAHEVESWNPTGQSYVWVKVPVFSATDDTSVLMYYGNDTAPSVGNVTSDVWSNGYEVAYHLTDDVTGAGASVSESASGFDAIANNLVGATGIAGGGLDFDGASGYLEIGSDVALLENATGITASAWVHLDDITAGQNIHAISMNGSALSRFELSIESGEIQVRVRALDADPAVFVATTTSPLIIGQWQQIAVTVDLANDTIHVYVDGVEQALQFQGSSPTSFPTNTIPDTNPDVARIGRNEAGPNVRFLDGRLDEVRVAHVYRSAEWILAQYAAQDDQLLTFSGAQTASGVQVNDLDREREVVSTTLVTGSGPTNAASFTLRADGSFEYTPDADFTGTDSFQYQFTDVYGESDTATVTINVTPVNDRPTDISLDNLLVAENTPGAVVGKFTTTDADDGDTHTYTVSDNRFEVVGDVLKLKDGEVLDFESEGSVTMDVTTKDGDGLTFTRSGTLTVTDNNDAPTAVNLSSTDVDENNVAGVIGTVSVEDEDATDTFTYLVDDSRFEFDGNILQLKSGERLDHENESTVSLAIKAFDSANTLVSRTFTIDVNDINEAPTSISIDNQSVSENAGGAVIGNLSTADVDDSDSHTYTVNDTRFEVVGNSLRLKSGVSLDFETEPSVILQVTSTDSGLLPITQAFTVTVGDVNEVPTSIALDNATVTEGSAGAVIGNLSTTDVDDSDSHTYTVDDTRFEVVGNSLRLKAGVSFDFETEPTVTLQVTSTDSGLLPLTQAFTVTVGDVNEVPTSIALDNATVTEGTAAAVIGNLSTTDVDDSDSHTYMVDDTRFEVVGNSLRLKAGVSLDFETESSVNLQVTSTDSGLLAITQSFTVTVGDVNEVPSAITLDNVTVTEESAGATIGVLSTTDVDDADSHTYTVDDTRFEVVGNSLQLKAGAGLDFETESSVTVQVTSTDSGLLATTQAFTVNVDDVNEIPTAISLGNMTVVEESDGATVGILSTSDVDDSDSHTYTVDDTRFEVVGNSLQLKAGAGLDFETESSVTVQVTSTDSGLLATTQAFTVNVDDVNETPTTISLGNMTVAEESDGLVIGVLSTTDVDDADSHTYTVDDSRFEVVGNSLQLRAESSLDFETESNVTIQVTSTDNGLLTTSQAFTIAVVDVNEAPAGIAVDNATVSEESLGATVGRLSTTDVDAGDSHTYSVSDIRFEIVGQLLRLKDGQTIDFETEPVLDLEVVVTDRGGLQTAQTISVTVVDVNESPVATDQTAAIDENSAAGTVVTTVTATDPEAGSLSWSIVGGSGASAFSIESSSGTILVSASALLNAEAMTSLTLLVQVSDGTQADTATITISINGVDESPVASATRPIRVAEDAPATVIDIDQFVEDPESPDALLSYIVDSVGTPALFESVTIDSTTGDLNIDYAPGVFGQTTITVIAQDPGGNTATLTFNVIVDEVEDLFIVTIPQAEVEAEAEVEEAEEEDSSSDDAEEEQDSDDETIALEANVGSSETSGEHQTQPAAAETATADEQQAAVSGPVAAGGVVNKQNESNRRISVALADVNRRIRGTESWGTSEIRPVGTDPYFHTLEFASVMADVQTQIAESEDGPRMMFETPEFQIAATGLTVGSIIWMQFAGSLVSSLMATVPAWANLDFITVMEAAADDGDDDSLGAMVDKADVSDVDPVSEAESTTQDS